MYRLSVCGSVPIINGYAEGSPQGRGIGRRLFGLIAEWAKKYGGEKLYISAHSSVESQSFYKAVGCVEAEEYNPVCVEKEPFDCQLEFSL